MATYFSILDSRGCLQLSGPDAREFLQGQTTCDMGTLSPAQSVLGACCTPQGRVVFDFRALLPEPEQIVLSMQADICGRAAEVLGKYIVFSKAQVVDATAAWVQAGCWGEGAEALAGLAGDSGASELRDGLFWTRCDAEGSRYEILAPASRAAALQDWLGQRAQQQPEAVWREQEIRAGLGHIETATTGQLLPQELNYQDTGHVSFTKGCYTGQEIVARLHYKGKTKRPMHLARYPGDRAPAAGTDIVEVDSQRPVGTVVNSVARDGQVWLLASCSDADGATLAVAGSGQSPLAFTRLV